MSLLPAGWHIPYGQAQCKAANASFSCDYALYASATALTTEQKLVSNSDITGKLLFKSFIITAISSLVLSVILCFDKFYCGWTQGRKHEVTEHKHYLKAVHTVETLLHTFSDQQLVLGLSLLFALNAQACAVSAYDFNLVCTMLLLSVAVHLNALIMISDFIMKGKTVAVGRIASVMLQLALTGVVFSARNTAVFPFEPQSPAILPAACFENVNATSAAGLADMAGFFADAIVLALFVALAAATLLAEWLGTATGWNRHIGWASVAVSIASTAATLGLTAHALQRTAELTSGMEVDAWCRLDLAGNLSLSQLMPVTLLASTLFPLINAVKGSLPLKSRRFVSQIDTVESDFKIGVTTLTEYEKMETQYLTQSDV